MSVYKSERPDYLDRALHSIWDEQELKPDEIVLIQDGPVGMPLSTVIDNWKERLGSSMKIHRNEVNIGLTKSLNIGIGLTQCDLIARMDSDDKSLPCRFRLQHDFLLNHPDIDILGGSMEMVDENGNVKYVRHYPLVHEEIVSVMPKRSPFAHPLVMMRMKPFKEKGLAYDERYRNSQDIALWFDALHLGCKMANLPDVILKFTEAGDVYSRRGKVRAKNEFLAWMRGINKNYGFLTFKYVYPLGRYVIRRLPSNLIKLYYNSSFYRKLYAK